MKKILLFCALFLLSSHFAFADTSSNLYQIDIPVGTENPALRDAAFQQAWEQILIKVSGNSQIIVNNPSLKKTKPTNYISSYSYKSLEKPSADELPYNLNIQFQEQGLLEYLQKINQTPWTGDRPALLAWITLQDQQGSRLLSADSNEPILKPIQSLALQRGIPVIIPILDLSTLDQISIENINNSNWDLIEKLSAPYQQGATLLLQLTQNNDSTWASHAQLLVDQATQEWTLTGPNENVLLIQSLNTIMDAFANHYTTLLSAPDNTISIQINQINSLEQYSQAKDLLAHLSLVSAIAVTQVSPSTISFSLKIKGDQTALQNALQDSTQLFLVDTNNLLTYAWQTPVAL